ncbi:hypothetical protein CONLIGDRAFT_61925 [Coniochaeta ligniaria NRRL 30616]|uniref:Uncharacterized protein n=1 Tax=Coniochaeta ligniaria NRRL 30616 TaxID=1408157 RepID=A0A1J7K5K1_9PEZI|nr:hypothetical protein CONLIGDRAFT_61925 [Coniochaeta ligniaria NRRL 30616]
MAALLISLCPNITTLRVYGIYSSHLLGQFLLENNYGKLKLPRPALQKLKEVKLHPVMCFNPENYDYLESIDELRYFHRLPAINSISLQGLEDSNADDMLFPPKTSSGIKKINIDHSDMGGQTIGNIIRIPKALEEFSLSTGGLSNADAGNAILFPKTLSKCLLEHRDSLRELDLDAAVTGPHGDMDEHGRDPDGGEAEWNADQMSQWYFVQDMEDSDSSESSLWAEDLPNTREYTALSIGSMHDFRALTRLSIRIGLILGYDDISSYEPPVPSDSYRLVDALPPNLEFLRLYGYRKGEHAHIDAHVAELLEKKAERFPKLGEIEGVDEFLPGVAGRYGRNPDDDDIWERDLENLYWADCNGEVAS